jgi:cell division protein ZapA (FtsZ GTPase activity inhibitor)
MSSVKDTMAHIAVSSPETIWLIQLFIMIAVLPMTCLYLTSNRFANKVQDEKKSIKTKQAEKVLSSLS